MAPKRAAGQVFVGCWCTEELVAKIAAVRRGSMSGFVRDAIDEKLRGKAVVMSPQTSRAPHRKRDGRPFAFGATPGGGVIANDARNLNPGVEAARRLAEQVKDDPAALLRYSKQKGKIKP